jgi:CO/xanthine dehydrogenase FAD-binding subunit
MKAAEFDYVRAGSLAEVCDLLADPDIETKIIAGGQTLVPLMVMRMARPERLVDINHVAELQGVRVEGDELVIGACTRQRHAERSPEVQANLPLLALALTFVGHTQTRNRGTVGGSIVNADPSAEIALVATALDATMVCVSRDGETARKASAFFEDVMTTAIEETECLVAVRFPVWRGGRAMGVGFHEISARASDFAVASAAAQMVLDEAGACERVTLAVGGVAAKPFRVDAAIDALTGALPDDDAIAAAIAHVDPFVEIATEDAAELAYRRGLARTVAERALRDARDAARKGLTQ